MWWTKYNYEDNKKENIKHLETITKVQQCYRGISPWSGMVQSLRRQIQTSPPPQTRALCLETIHEIQLTAASLNVLTSAAIQSTILKKTKNACTSHAKTSKRNCVHFKSVISPSDRLGIKRMKLLTPLSIKQQPTPTFSDLYVWYCKTDGRSSQTCSNVNNTVYSTQNAQGPSCKLYRRRQNFSCMDREHDLKTRKL